MTEYDFSRQIKVSGVGKHGQKALQNARVLIAGAGGLGATAIPYLAAAGIGHLTIVDDDQVETSNLHRQIPFTYQDIGKYKAQLMAQFSRDRSPYGTFTTICRRLSSEEWLKAMQNHDLVLDCTDDRQLAYLLSDAALITQKPVIFANAAALNGQLFTLLPDEKNPCWRCLWSENMTPTGNCNAIGVIGAVPATLGCWQALTAIKLLTGMHVAGDEMLYYDFSTMRQMVLKVSKQENCPHQLTWQQFKNRHGQHYIYHESIDHGREEGLFIIDIRRPDEWIARPLPQADFCIEMQTLLNHPDQYLERDKSYLLVCAAGVRAKQSALQLHIAGYKNVFAFPKAW